MSKNPLFGLYEKLYFHEIEVREKLGGRLQTPMAIIVSLIGVLAYLLQNFDKDHISTFAALFIFLLTLSSLALVAAMCFFVCSWYGHTYAFLPSAEETEKYRQLLQKTYKQYKNGNTLAETYLNDYLCTKYIALATQNTQCNDKRSLNIHRTNGTLIVAVILVALTFTSFITGDLDKTKVSKPTEVVIVKPVDVKGAIMVEKKPEPPKEIKPPPPPPPPPTRLIKEGVEIIKPQPEKKDDQ
ncbi:MAG: hypothetical protein DID91_2727702655 [Candidatus Nitrotoga sp. MKT]|nr:MAG: hypothetical protein DID91_2727702655 [Candidatus Nitrotoga sp. MKT]